MPGPVPKPASKRRRRNVPVSYGAAQPTTAPAAPPVDGRSLGIDNPHPLIASLWNTVQSERASRNAVVNMAALNQSCGELSRAGRG